MAMVKCPECRKQVSDKDSKCPYCGAKVNVKICCPKCKSEDVELKVGDNTAANAVSIFLFGWLWSLFLRGNLKSSITARCKKCGKRFKLEKK